MVLRVSSDARLAPGGQRLDVPARLRGHAGHALHEIERDALAHEDAARLAAHGPELRAGAHELSVGHVAVDLELRVDAQEHAREDAPAADDDGLPRDGVGHGDGAFVDARLGGEVPRREVLLEREGDDAIDDDGGRFENHRFSSAGANALMGGVSRSSAHRVRLGKWRDSPYIAG